MKKYRIIVFPCGSEIGLEIYRSLKYSAHIELIGANSINDHGKFVYDNYIDNVPFVDAADFIDKISELVRKLKIDAIFPAMDKVLWKLKSNENRIGCKVISSPLKTAEICLSKKKTYSFLKDEIKVPAVYRDLNHIIKFPVFVKPDIGYGSRNVFQAENKAELDSFFTNKRNLNDYVISEYLTGDEYTIDCFTDKNGVLRFAGARIRKRILNGISVNTKPVADNSEYKAIAEKINRKLKFRGAWFFQLKRDHNNELTLLEIASRPGGASALYRAKGINFALLSIYDAFDHNVEILENDFSIELDRALDNKYIIDIEYKTIYVDFDDCLVINGEINYELVSFLYKAINNNKEVILLSKHSGNLKHELKKYRLDKIFDQIIHISKNDNKYEYISSLSAIFIDDSFSERKEVKIKKSIITFDTEAIPMLIQNL
ncbi:MAG: ATP-grasp domain-containing protein [Victivallaceae bacterium]